ncbi:leucine rich adaptor protein 1 [Egretta garzetta]|uniref:leucine rich adaptor protein 1 n=1 Tax=Egretta garzetta TaxID=188379 RepID=UPI00051F15B4|nr:leucine rich adaptor protein 1 [Egretta garzetta]
MVPCRVFPYAVLFIKQIGRPAAITVGTSARVGWDSGPSPTGVTLVPSKTVHSLSPCQAYLRAVDVKILQQLVVVNEGIEAVKWLLEERSTNDRLDSISVGSYLDTLADDMDEYSQNAAETAAASATGRALVRAEQDWVRIDPERGLAKQEKGKAEHEWPHVDLSPPGLPQDHRFAKEPQVANGYLGQQPSSLEPGRDTKLPSGAGERLGKGNPGGKARKAEADFENCKLNSKLHLEYDAHWRWLQSQDDVTFL